MQIKPESLQKAASQGSAEVKRVFEQLSKKQIRVEVSESQSLTTNEILSAIKERTGEAVIAYAQMLSGASGISLFVMSREETLLFVDLMTEKDIGTTGVISDYDRSVVKETLNILSNAYLTALSEESGAEFMIGPPYMITQGAVDRLLPISVKTTPDEQAVMLSVELDIAGHDVKGNLYLIFHPDIVESFKSL